MGDKVRVGMAQLNLALGDLDGNAEMIVSAYREAVAGGAQLVVFSELAVTGYPPEDLLLKPAFISGAAAALERIAAATGEAPAVVGYPEDSGAEVPVRLWNSAALCWGGEVRGTYRKHLLPNYAVFDEQRYFLAGTSAGPLLEVDNLEVGNLEVGETEAGGVRVGISICEDLWGPLEGPLTGAKHPNAEAPHPLTAQAAMGAQLAVVINGSPYHRGKRAEREELAGARARQLGIGIVYVNQVGGQDELVFDGGSFAVDATGSVIARLAAFDEQVAVCEVPVGAAAFDASVGAANPLVRPPEPTEEVWRALALATRDYVRKNGFTQVAVGLSGGIDSSAVAAIAADALGPANVHGVSMPSRYSSPGSRADAEALAANLGIDFRTVPIEPAHAALAAMLDEAHGEGDDDLDERGGSEPGAADLTDLTDQNLQSRIRGVLLMALSNRCGWLVLTTGNKTETSVGYTTLYGDTVGGYAPIQDVPKLLVYELCKWRNAQGDGPVVPEACITKPPSAELAPGQRDDQSLPPYELLDPLVEAYVEGDLTSAELLGRASALGESAADPDLVARVTRLIDIAEFKRRQSPPGPRISEKAFGKDRRMPITNLFR